MNFKTHGLGIRVVTAELMPGKAKDTKKNLQALIETTCVTF